MKKRQQTALERLQKQLQQGTKPFKNEQGKTTDKRVPLQPSDIARIEREIEILKR